MDLALLPLWVFFAGAVLVVLSSMEIGFRLGIVAHRRRKAEKEANASAVTASVLSLVAFMLAFTFGIVANRYDARKSLVREEANAVGTTYLRSDFLPEVEGIESKRLLKQYIDGRLAVIGSGSFRDEDATKLSAEAERIHGRLWEIGVANARKDMNSDIGALYIESVNQVIDLNALRLAVAVQARVPFGIWFVLLSLSALGMMSMGYQEGISESSRTLSCGFLAVSFALVIVLIAALDRPMGIVQVTQQPLIDLQHSIEVRERLAVKAP